jgi:hypothetical protein
MDQMEYAYKNDQKKLWQLFNRFAPFGKKTEVTPMRQADGTIAKTVGQISET